MKKYPKYQEISKILGGAKQLVSPSEAHGLMCGIICAGLNDLDEADWESVGFVVHEADDPDFDEQAALTTLFQASQEKLVQMEFDFQLLLPDEDTTLSLRAKEFGAWCQGFISGFGLAGGQLNENKNFETTDALKKIAEAARIDHRTLVIREEDEKAFMEVTEYVRMAVLMIYAEMHTGQSGNGSRESDKNFH